MNFHNKVEEISMYLHEIASLEYFIYELQKSLYMKQEEIDRLEMAQSNLIELQEEFFYNQSLCKSPTLCKNTWHGKLAKDFQTFQEDKILDTYQKLTKDKMNEILNRLAEEIEAIAQSIVSIERTIATKKLRLQYVREISSKEILK